MLHRPQASEACHMTLALCTITVYKNTVNVVTTEAGPHQPGRGRQHYAAGHSNGSRGPAVLYEAQ
jgi:hypothetical protein